MSVSAVRPLLTPTIISFPDAGTSEAVSRHARKAMLEFYNGGLFWDKRALAKWLLESYGPIAKKGEGEEESRAMPYPTEPTIHRIVTDARQVLASTLRLSMDGHSSASFAWKMIRQESVAQCEDEEGRGWVPVARPRMRLRDRVLSLWAVDFLSHDHEYAHEFALCKQCGFAEFDAIARASGACRAHRNIGSGFHEAWAAESETRIRVKRSVLQVVEENGEQARTGSDRRSR